MVSDYLQRTRSLEELDAFFERDRRKALEAAELVFSQEVAAAIRTIADINEVTNARILANTQVSSARIASSAEVHAMTLLAMAETLRLKIVKSGLSEVDGHNTQTSVVAELAQSAEEEITTSSSAAIDEINAHATLAVEQITASTKSSIAEIKKISEDVSSQIDDNARLAKEKLEEAKKHTRTPEETKEAASEAAVKISAHAALNSATIAKVVSDSVAFMNKAADAAIKQISTSVDDATERIARARDKALTRIEGFLTARR